MRSALTPLADRTGALLANADYQPLLQSLEKIIETEAERKLCLKERQELEDVICIVADLYYIDPLALSGSQSLYDRVAELGAPIKRVIEILEEERCRDWVFHCLESPLGPQRLDRLAVPAELENLLVNLRKITRRVPPHRSRKRGPGRPRKSGDLEKIVELLAIYWKKTTSNDFTRDWEKREPLTAAMQFVHAVVGFIDAERLHQLPTVTRTVAEAQKDQRIL